MKKVPAWKRWNQERWVVTIKRRTLARIVIFIIILIFILSLLYFIK